MFLIAFVLPLGGMLVQLAAAVVRDPALIKISIIDTRQLVLLGRSCAIAGGASLAAVLLGLPCAFVLSTRDLLFRRLLFVLVVVPLLIPPYVMAGAWIHLLSPAGFVNRVLEPVFGSGISLYSMYGCMWCLGVSFFPIIAIVVSAGLNEADGNLIDMTRMSTGGWGVFRYGILPQVWPHVVSSVCLVMIFVLAQYGVPSLLGVNTYPVEIFAQFSAFYDEVAAFATAMPLMLIVCFLVLLQRRLMRGYDYIRFDGSQCDNRLRLGGVRPYAIAGVVLIFIITTLSPLISVVSNAGGFGKVVSVLRQYSSAILTSTILGLVTAVVCTAVGFAIGRGLAKRAGRFGKVVEMLIWLAVATPGTIVAIGVIRFSGMFGPIRGNDNVVLVCCYVGMFSAFSAIAFYASFRRADVSLEDAADMDCINWYQRLIYVELPLHKGAVAASLIIVFVLVLGELNATVLLLPPGGSTLSVSIDNLLHYGASAQASVLCLTEAMLTVIIFAAGYTILSIINKGTK